MDGRRRMRAGAASAVLGAVVVLAVLIPAGSALVVATAETADAQCAPRLVVSRTSDLAAAGETLTVSGSCYDVAKGVYVAFCVVPPAGSAPTPCGGGVDMSGSGGLSHWISSNPPPQGAGLTTPYGPGGSFTVTMRPSAALNPRVDCRRVSCAVVTRNDHTRTSDRSQDVIVPVSFAADPPPAPTTTAPAAVLVPPPTEAPTTTSPEATTTSVAPEDTTVATVPVDGASGRADLAAPASEQLATEPASASAGASGPSVGLIAAAVVAVAVVAVGGLAGWSVRRRPSVVGAGADDPVDGPQVPGDGS